MPFFIISTYPAMKMEYQNSVHDKTEETFRKGRLIIHVKENRESIEQGGFIFYLERDYKYCMVR